jgi:uroporphyrinogen decarboxylase
MSTGRETYTRAIEQRNPPYVPVVVDVPFRFFREQDPAKFRRIQELQAGMPKDLLRLHIEQPDRHPVEEHNGVRRWKDHWGTGWLDDGHGARVVTHPLADGYDAAADYVFPDPARAEYFAAADRALTAAGDRYVLGHVWFTLFERMWMLRGFENLLVDPLLHPEEFALFRDRMVAYDLAMIDAWTARGVHGIFFSDDWGTQRGLLIDPDLWRGLYKPAYARLFSRVHAAGAHVWMHLCGDVRAILPDLVEIGLDVLNPVQPQAMDIVGLAREFGGRLCFYGGADVQGTLVRGTPQDVRSEARRLLHVLASERGGYIASTSHGLMPETPLDNVIALLETWIADCFGGKQ